ncbi:MAG: 50S ribosomal protein L11 methyltransferase [Clostridia bacterium]|nr:50S ribosomal protein L11 methyltransferase [Clostridia bacterium]
MEWIELIVHTTTQGSDAVSETLMAAGANGTMVEDRADIPDPDKPNGYWEIIDRDMKDKMPEDVLVHAWLEPDDRLRDRIVMIRSGLDAMRCEAFGSLTLEQANVRDEDWLETWKQYFKPFRAGKSLVIKPTWESYAAQPSDKVIEIDPGMAFGSGKHETTAMCLELLEQELRGGEEVIDVGTGSGILAIGAALLGARHVLAIDIDPDAVRVAKENIVHNGFEDRITAVRGDLLKDRSAVCDVCVANIIADIICAFASPLRAKIRPGGTFIASGIIKERENEVVRAVTEAGYRVAEVRRRGEWVALLCRRD